MEGFESTSSTTNVNNLVNWQLVQQGKEQYHCIAVQTLSLGQECPLRKEIN